MGGEEEIRGQIWRRDYRGKGREEEGRGGRGEARERREGKLKGRKKRGIN